MKIDKIKKLKNNNYKITIDGETIITFDSVILEQKLLLKKVIDKDVYVNILNSTEYYSIYNKAYNYAIKKMRCEKEIREYLIKLNISENIIEKIIFQLKKINLINDVQYCKAFINDKVYLSKNGINKIKQDLLNQNIPINIIDQEIRNVDDNVIYNRLEKMIIKKIKCNTKYSYYELKQKILNNMIGLGYDKELILQIIENNKQNNKFILEKEYNKIYNNYKRKYNEQELFIKIKQKLLYRGFKLDEVNELMKSKNII